MALPNNHRLRSSQDFGQVYRKGAKAATRNLALRALRLPVDANSPRNPLIRSASTCVRSKGVVPKRALTSKMARSRSAVSGATVPENAAVKSAVLAPPLVSPSRFGISISRKVSKHAVVRNRIKRQLQAIIQRNLSRIGPGWQVVIIVRPSAVECGFDEFLRELEYLLKKLKILN